MTAVNKELADVGLIGLGTMGQNLAHNITNHGFSITVYNRTGEKTKQFVASYGNDTLQGEIDLSRFVASLKRPRKIIILVSAGAPVDSVIEELLPRIDNGDIIIDCGNSHYRDTMRRFNYLKENDTEFIGCGVSGGEEGALHGPSFMPGGSQGAWEKVKPVFEATAAKDFSDRPCVSYIGNTGAGHYVKMVHNGIEYGVMELMAEVYDLFRSLYGLKAPQIADIFASFGRGKLRSYLFDISVPVLRRKDDLSHGYLIDHILDVAGQKGTGGWTTIDAIERNIPVPTIAEAVFARAISSQDGIRRRTRNMTTKKTKPRISLKKFIPVAKNALFGALLVTYAQGYHLISAAGKTEQWSIDLGELSRIWQGGCIIRADMLRLFHNIYSKQKESHHLFTIPHIQSHLATNLPALRGVILTATAAHVPTPALAASYAYTVSMSAHHLPANFIQGLRDFFGAHTYQRTDRDGTFHTSWQE